MEEITHKMIWDKLNHVENLIQFVVKQKVTNKEEALMRAVQERGRLDTKAVMVVIQASRVHSLNLMERIPRKYPGFRYSPGSSKTKKSSVIIFNESLLLQDQHNKIKKLLAEREIITLSNLMTEFSMQLDDVRAMVNDFLTLNPKYELVGNNKIALKGTIKETLNLTVKTAKNDIEIKSDEVEF